MNAKLCKQLRRVARDLQGSPVTDRSYSRHHGHFNGPIVLRPDSVRGMYRRLKKEFRK